MGWSNVHRRYYRSLGLNLARALRNMVGDRRLVREQRGTSCGQRLKEFERLSFSLERVEIASHK